MVSLYSFNNKIRFFLSSLVVFYLIKPDLAYAVQSHGELEGLIAHQIGHILFALGVLLILFISRKNVIGETGWVQFRLFLIFVFLWNLSTFCGHWLGEKYTQDNLLFSDSRKVSVDINSVMDALYYFTKLDHLILVPAFVFLLLALKRWVNES